MIGSIVTLGCWGFLGVLVVIGVIRDVLRNIEARTRPQPRIARTLAELERMYYEQPMVGRRR